MKRDYVVTFATELLVLLSVFGAFRIAAMYWGTTGFSEYSLTKRLFALLQPIVLMGLAVGIPRYIALKNEELSTLVSHRYFLGGSAILIGSAVLFYFLINAFPHSFAYIFYGSSEYATFMPSIGMLIFGICLHSIAYTYYRGHLIMVRANVLRFINSSVVILLVFLIPQLSVQMYFFCVGLSWCIVSLVAMLSILKTVKLSQVQWLYITNHATELLKYGVMRVPADIGLAGLLTLPAILTAHTFGVREAGFVAFGTSILNMTSGAFLPIGLVLLPVASRMVARRDFDELGRLVRRILRYACGITLIAVIIVFLFADKIIAMYLGLDFAEVAGIVRVIAVGILPFVVYVVLRNVLDAIKVKPLNTKNILVCFVVYLLAAGVVVILSESYLYIVWALAGCLVILGVLSFIDFSTYLERLKRGER